jgi:hypothetical protein
MAFGQRHASFNLNQNIKPTGQVSDQELAAARA